MHAQKLYANPKITGKCQKDSKITRRMSKQAQK
jgi:hypothetical protein